MLDLLNRSFQTMRDRREKRGTAYKALVGKIVDDDEKLKPNEIADAVETLGVAPERLSEDARRELQRRELAALAGTITGCQKSLEAARAAKHEMIQKHFVERLEQQDRHRAAAIAVAGKLSAAESSLAAAERAERMLDELTAQAVEA